LVVAPALAELQPEPVVAFTVRQLAVVGEVVLAGGGDIARDAGGGEVAEQFGAAGGPGYRHAPHCGAAAGGRLGRIARWDVRHVLGRLHTGTQAGTQPRRTANHSSMRTSGSSRSAYSRAAQRAMPWRTVLRCTAMVTALQSQLPCSDSQVRRVYGSAGTAA